MRVPLLASGGRTVARRIYNLYSRRWFRTGLYFAVAVVLLDLWLTVRLSAPGTNAVLPVSPGGESSSADLKIGGGDEGKKEKLFVASIHWNDGEILEAHWIPAVLELVKVYGASNLYISIHESGSWDETKNRLRDLDRKLEGLGVERSLVMEEKTHEDEIKIGEDEIQAGQKKEGWIMGSRGKREMRRIPYLAQARNKAMAPLKMLAEKEGEKRRVFDRVVWLNDVIFSVRPPLFLHSPYPSMMNQLLGEK